MQKRPSGFIIISRNNLTPDQMGYQNLMKYPIKIVSSRQTGVDRAGLDVGIQIGLPVGGYVSKGRLAEDGQVPDKYPMMETGSKDYKSRTKRNVLESDGTLTINIGPMKTGTALTAKTAQENFKPAELCFPVRIKPFYAEVFCANDEF